MPNRPPKRKTGQTPSDQEVIADKAKKVKPTMKEQRIDQTGLTSRVKGHVSSRGKRSQGKRDSKS